MAEEERKEKHEQIRRMWKEGDDAIRTSYTSPNIIKEIEEVSEPEESPRIDD